MGVARDIFNPSHAIYNAVKNPNEGLSGTFKNSGTVGKILNPAAYAVANKSFSPNGQESSKSMSIAQDILNPAHAIYNAVRHPDQGLSGTFKNSGIAGQILNPAAYAFANKRPGSSTFGAGGPVNTALDPADVFGGQKAFTSAQANTFDPHAPGSIFANRPVMGGAPNMPAPGTPTNGLANGAMNGGIDWASIIAHALRKT